MEELLYNFNGYNEKIFYIINNACSSIIVQYFFEYISAMFDIEMIAIYYTIIATILLYRIIKLKNYEQYSFCYDFMVKFGIGYGLFGLTYAALKFGINMPRPFCSLPQQTFTTIIDISKERCHSSFPSSHAGIVFFITIFLWNYVQARARLIWLILIGLVATSRMALAMHYPADIFYSFFIAYGIYVFGMKIYHLLADNLIMLVKEKIGRYLF